jgi:aconitate hydratase
VQQFIAENITRDLFKARYADVFRGDDMWATIHTSTGLTYGWDDKSTYVQNPPYFQGITKSAVPLTDIQDARVLALFGDKITTDHISPAGSIKANTCSTKA